MSKKKSYMNKDNILSEGFYTNLIKFFLPKKVKDNLKQSQLNRLQNDIDKIDKEIRYHKKQQSDAAEKMIKALEKQTGTKIKKYKSAKDRIKAYYDKEK
tara:strand:- start:523 stop:819 length:297 start_codon:yes stop_codon:yes gene_type:complete